MQNLSIVNYFAKEKHRGATWQVPQVLTVGSPRIDACVVECGISLHQYRFRGDHLNGSTMQPEI